MPRESVMSKRWRNSQASHHPCMTPPAQPAARGTMYSNENESAYLDTSYSKGSYKNSILDEAKTISKTKPRLLPIPNTVHPGATNQDNVYNTVYDEYSSPYDNDNLYYNTIE